MAIGYFVIRVTFCIRGNISRLILMSCILILNKCKMYSTKVQYTKGSTAKYYIYKLNQPKEGRQYPKMDFLIARF